MKFGQIKTRRVSEADGLRLFPRLRFGFLCGLALIMPSVVRAEFAPDDIVFFERQIRPLLEKRCFECHSAKEQEAGLRLDSRIGILRGGAAGPAAVPGDANKSLLIEAIHYENPDFQMPPGGKLSGDEIELLEQWVKMGLPWPASEGLPSAIQTKLLVISPERRVNWRFLPLRRARLKLMLILRRS